MNCSFAIARRMTLYELTGLLVTRKPHFKRTGSITVRMILHSTMQNHFFAFNNAKSNPNPNPPSKLNLAPPPWPLPSEQPAPPTLTTTPLDPPMVINAVQHYCWAAPITDSPIPYLPWLPVIKDRNFDTHHSDPDPPFLLHHL